MILPLEQQCCSLESAKRLKELNCPQESLFYHYTDRVAKTPCIGLVSQCASYGSWEDAYSAYTVAELGEFMPVISKHTNTTFLYWSKVWHGKRLWFCEGMKMISDNNEAESRAKALIYLIENKLIEVRK